MREIEFEDSSGPVDEASISGFESLIGGKLPDSYRGFLKATNGGSLSPRNRRFIVADHPYFGPDWGYLEVSDFLRLKSDDPQQLVLSKALKYAKHRIPPGTLPVAGDPWGNSFLLGIAEPIRGMVYFWDHECSGIDSSPSGNPFENVPKLADSFEEFVDALVETQAE